MDIATFPQNPEQEQDISSTLTLCTACGATDTLIHDFTNGEYACNSCGAISEEATKIGTHEFAQTESAEQATAEDHNAGNGLYNSVTVQVDYVSSKNPGLAMMLCNTRLKDKFGSKIKRQLVDPYQAMLYAGKDWHVEVNKVTGKANFKFSRYDSPTLKIAKEFAEQVCTDLHFDTVQKTHIAAELKRLYSQLVMSEIVPWMVYSAITKYSHWLTPEMLQVVEDEIRDSVDEIKIKIITRCDKELIKQIKKEAKEQLQQQEQQQQSFIEVKQP